MSNYRFSKEAPSQDLLNDLQNLGSFGDSLFDELIDLLLGFLAQEEDFDFPGAIQNLSKVCCMLSLAYLNHFQKHSVSLASLTSTTSLSCKNVLRTLPRSELEAVTPNFHSKSTRLLTIRVCVSITARDNWTNFCLHFVAVWVARSSDRPNVMRSSCLCW